MDKRYFRSFTHAIGLLIYGVGVILVIPGSFVVCLGELLVGVAEDHY